MFTRMPTVAVRKMPSRCTLVLLLLAAVACRSSCAASVSKQQSQPVQPGTVQSCASFGLA